MIDNRPMSQEEAARLFAAQCGDLSGCNFTGVTFWNDCLEFADLSHAILDDTVFYSTIFDHCDLRHASIKNANLQKSSFNDANLTGTVFTGSRLDGAYFLGAYIVDIDCIHRLVTAEDFKDAASILGAEFGPLDEPLETVGA